MTTTGITDCRVRANPLTSMILLVALSEAPLSHTGPAAARFYPESVSTPLAVVLVPMHATPDDQPPPLTALRLLTEWSLDWWLVVGLAIPAVLYAAGLVTTATPGRSLARAAQRGLLRGRSGHAPPSPPSPGSARTTPCCSACTWCNT